MPDNLLAADFMLSINLQESFRLFRFMPSRWFNNRKLRIFDFEFHITPFVDLALVKDPLRSRSFHFDDMIATGGIEATAFPFYFKTTYIRASYGIDLQEMIKTGSLPDGDYNEIYVGMGHYF
jgi:hypothetical protein